MSQVITIPYHPRFPQNVIHPKIEAHRFWVLVAHRRLGKSVLAINHLIKKATQNTLLQPRYAFVAPWLKQAKLIAWDYLKRYSAPIPGTKVNESELSVEFPNRAKVWLFGADNPDAIRGTYLDGAVLDEYALIKPEVFGEIIRPALADRNGWCGFIGTPKGQNQFLEVYEKAQKNMAEGDPNWWCSLYRADETGVIPQDELAQMKSVLSEATYRQEFLCDFTAASENVLIPIDLVSQAAARKLVDRDVMYAPKVLGIDVARFGNDRSVIFRRQGLQAFTPKVFSQIDNMTFAGHAAAEINDFRPDAVFIDAGRGEGVIDRLRQLGYRVSEVNFGGQPLNPTYKNKRAEMWDLMREWLEHGGAIPNMPDLKSDLVIPTYDFDPANRMRLEEKEKIKERLGKSPDLGDALALTFSFPVNTRREFDQGRKPKLEFAKSEYDVLA